MPVKARITSVRTDKPEEISFSIGVPVLEILEAEARAFAAGNLPRTEFARLLLRNKGNRVRAQRPDDAKAHKPLKNVEHERGRLSFKLAPADLGILIELCNVLGLGSKSMVMAHLILDWVGISPLREGFSFDVTKQLKQLRASGKSVPRTTKLMLLQLAPAIHELLEQEAQLLGMRRPKDVVVAILNSRIVGGALLRPEHFPKRLPLGNVKHEKEQLGVLLPQPQDELLREASRRLGGAEMSSIASHLILEWIGISPLTDGYELQGAPEETAAQGHAVAKRKTTRTSGASKDKSTKKRGRAGRARRR